jgi:glycosyltransferase involved in cell wall biosynthesis
MSEVVAQKVSSNERPRTAVDITLLVCTYNRANDLRELLETGLAQETGGAFTYEILVVDNNSSDDTRAVVERFIAAGHENLRYLFEGRQGKSHALNSGLQAVRGWAYVIADDDFVLPPDWVKGIYEGFRAHPEVSFVSGKVLPQWQSEPPAWLTTKHWSAIAMADYGEEEFITDQNHQVCLLACAFRLADVNAVGGYHGDLGPQKGRTGATEDLDLLKRLWKSGRTGLYLPHVAFYHKATSDRVTKEYHRRWHRDHGRSYAVMRAEETEAASTRLFDVPGHMYRAAAGDALSWLKCRLSGKADEAFWHEIHLRFFAGFFRQRRADFMSGEPRGAGRELAAFMRGREGRKGDREAAGEVK